MVSVPVLCLKSSGTRRDTFYHGLGKVTWRERLPPIVWDCQGSQVPQAVAPVTVGLVAGKVTCDCRFCGERSANLQEVNR